MTVNKSDSAEDDLDLQDLIQEEEDEALIQDPSSSSSTQKYGNYYNFNTASKVPSNSTGFCSCNLLLRIPELLCFYCTSCLLDNPFLGKIAAMAVLAGIIVILLNLQMFAPTQSIGVIKNNLSKLESIYDFDIGKVDHWCITGNDKCSCPDPLNATPRLHKAWHAEVKKHADIIQKNLDTDIVFLGQTLMEAVNGNINGHDMSGSDFFGRVKHIFQHTFSGDDDPKQKETPVKAISLGLTGDSSSNVLWRLMNGELPDNFNPPIWWLVLGMEDIGRFMCSEEITILGVLRVVEEIKKRRPDAKIVINSLFPMIKMRMKVAEDEKEFIDAERDHGKGPKPRGERQQNRKRNHDEGHGRKLESHEEKNDDDGKKHGKKDEKLRKRMEKNYEKAVKKDKFNPHMKETHKFKKNRKRPGSNVPMWTAIHTVNKQLHEFCQKTPHVTFFDTTEIFASHGEGGDWILQTDMISPRGHPTLEGFKKWLGVVKTQASEWKKKMNHVKEHHANDSEQQKQWFMNDKDYYEDLEGIGWYPDPDEFDDHKENVDDEGKDATNEEEEGEKKETDADGDGGEE